MAAWLKRWDSSKIPNLFSQFKHPQLYKRTLLCQASLIEGLLSDGFKFVLTALSQSDPIERRFGHYRQMSGGRSLVGPKDVIWSERILKSLVKGYLHYKTIISQNVPPKAQIKNFFISYKNYVPFSRYSSFCIFNHPMIYQISDVTMSIST